MFYSKSGGSLKVIEEEYPLEKVEDLILQPLPGDGPTIIINSMSSASLRFLAREISSENLDLPPSYHNDSVIEENPQGCYRADTRVERMKKLSLGLLGQFRSGVLQLPPDLKLAHKSLISILSTLYALLLIVISIAFASTEKFTDLPENYFESCGFNTYVYVISIGFMLYLFCYVIRAKNSGFDDDEFDSGDFIRRMNLATGLTLQEVKPAQKEPLPIRRRRRLFSFSPPEIIPIPDDPIELKTEVSVKMISSENDTSHGSLFLRMGAMAFGLGTLIYTGLEFLTFFEVPKDCYEWSIFLAVNPILYMIFVFMQMYFIFNHSRLNLHKHKVLAKFGMMHLIANNICILIRTLVKETVKEIGSKNNQNKTIESDQECIHSEIISGTIQKSSIYLFPFIIEYSIIGSAVLYSMWAHIGENPVYVMEDSRKSNKQEKKIRRPLDWSSSSLGLFMGLLSLVCLIIALILFFALVKHENYKFISVMMCNTVESVVNLLMIIAAVKGLFSIQHLKFVLAEDHVDPALIITSFGIYLYRIFSILGCALNNKHSHVGFSGISLSIIELFQVSTQLIFMGELKQKCMDESKPNQKPGRQEVTFLVIANLSFWIIYNFEAFKDEAHPDQVEFFGWLPWVIIQRITLPLCILFRFKSAAILATLWKKSYRKKD